ncbi:MAG: DegT/DnrJ/EryC1/StrS aminotransferase family protein [Sphaerochaetaceae bacterium]|nr:DegT/DnrJ/EryC1/StrS aminotransferase family protein [Sphaerochaetaceae bacterium]
MISFYKPTLKRKDMDSVLQTMVVDSIGPGSKAHNFVQTFCEYTKTTRGAAFRTYPDAIRASLKALGVGEGVNVAISPLAPVLYYEILKEFNPNIFLVDVDSENGYPLEEEVRKSNAQVLILYGSYGSLPLKYNKETTFAEPMNYGEEIKIIEDISETLGSTMGTDLGSGSLGNIIICAFEENNVVSAGGGAIVCVKRNLNYKMEIINPSYYSSMTDLNASLGQVQLDNLEDNSKKRREILKTYQGSLSKTRHKMFGFNMLDFQSNGSGFPVFLDSKPEETIKFGQKYDVPIKKAFEKSIFSALEGDLFEIAKVAATYYYRTVLFPLYPFLENNEKENIAKVLSHLP